MSPKRLLLATLVREATESIDVGRLRELAEHKSAQVRMGVADNPVVPDDVLLLLAEDADSVVPFAAAGNPTSRPDVERVLAASQKVGVRQVLAHKYMHRPECLPWDVQATLAHDSDWEVRSRIAETTNYRDIFDTCLRDGDVRVRGSCAHNPRAGEAEIELLMADQRAEVRASVAGGWFARVGEAPTDDQLMRLARDRSGLVRYNVISREFAPRRAWEIIAQDTDEINRNEAIRRLQGESWGDECPVSSHEREEALDTEERVQMRMSSDCIKQQMMFEGTPFDLPPSSPAA